MRYWWVNQNQTYRTEVRGSFMWSPKQNANGARNQFYENMREVSPGDVVFSFCMHQGYRCRDRRRADGAEADILADPERLSRLDLSAIES